MPKFRTQYNFDPKVDLEVEIVIGVSETDDSQNESLSQLIKRFVRQGVVIPPVEYEKQSEEDINAMLDNDSVDVNDDDFDLADASATLAEAQEIIQHLQKKQEVSKDTPKSEKPQEEPKMAQKEGEQAE